MKCCRILFILRILLRTRAYFDAPASVCLLPCGIKVSRRLLDRSGAIHMLAQKKEILWLKHPENWRDLILKKAMRPKTCVTEKCFWDTRLVNRFLWPDEARSFSPLAPHARITAAHWQKG